MQNSGMVYQWREGSHKSGDPQAVGERLEAIRVAAGGFLAPRAVVDDARDPAAPTHHLFAWDDARAADAYRLVQAREVIRSVAVVIPDHPAPTPAFIVVAVPKDATEDDTGADDDVTTAGLALQTKYTATVEAMRDPALRAQVLEQAKRELVSWRRRYANLRQFARLFGAVDELMLELGDGRSDTGGQ